MMWLAQVDEPRPQADLTSNPQIYTPWAELFLSRLEGTQVSQVCPNKSKNTITTPFKQVQDNEDKSQHELVDFNISF